MFALIVEFTLHAGHVDAFLRRVSRQAQDSLRLEADCHVFDVCVDPSDRDRVLLYEIYTDRAAFDAHLESAHFAEFDAEVSGWVAEKRLQVLTRL